MARQAGGTARAAGAVGAMLLALMTGCASVDDTVTAPSRTQTPTTTAPSTSTTTAPSTTEPTRPTTSSPSPPTTASPSAPTSSPTAPSPSPPPPATTPPTDRDATLGAGDSGPAVLALQRRLSEMGYWLGREDGEFGTLTRQAVLALQGAAGITRDGRVGPQTRSHLDAGTRPEARSSSGAVTEIDLDRGLILFVRDGAVTRVLHTSTGTFEKYTHEGRTLLADTPRGKWTVTWAQNGWRDTELGRLYRPRYFHRDGIAVHGYTNVPAYPASHGCARVTLPAMDMIWAQDLMPRGSAVWVY